MSAHLHRRERAEISPEADFVGRAVCSCGWRSEEMSIWQADRLRDAHASAAIKAEAEADAALRLAYFHRTGHCADFHAVGSAYVEGALDAFAHGPAPDQPDLFGGVA